MKAFLLRKSLFLAVVVPLLVVGCETETETEIDADTTAAMDRQAQETRATATLQPTQGNNVSGEITFTQTDDGTTQGLGDQDGLQQDQGTMQDDGALQDDGAMQDDGTMDDGGTAQDQGTTLGQGTMQDRGGVRIEGTISGLTEGQHGFHVHENGDCSAPDASSAGGHFNPTNAEHGAPDDPEGERHIGDLGNIEADESGTAEIDEVFDHITLNGQNSIVGKALVVHAGEDDLESQPSGDSGDRVACGVIEMQGPEGIENIQEDTVGTGPMPSETEGQEESI